MISDEELLGKGEDNCPRVTTKYLGRTGPQSIWPQCLENITVSAMEGWHLLYHVIQSMIAIRYVDIMRWSKESRYGC